MIRELFNGPLFVLRFLQFHQIAVIPVWLSEADVYVDPQNRFLLFASTDRNNGFDADDIFLYRRKDDGWSEPINLGPAVNSYAYEYGARVEIKGRFLYFNSYRLGSSDIYRVPIDEIPVLKNIINN